MLRIIRFVGFKIRKILFIYIYTRYSVEGNMTEETMASTKLLSLGPLLSYFLDTSSAFTAMETPNFFSPRSHRPGWTISISVFSTAASPPPSRASFLRVYRGRGKSGDVILPSMQPNRRITYGGTERSRNSIIFFEFPP